MEDGSPGLERLAGDGDRGHAAPDDAVPLEDSDLADGDIVGVGVGVAAEEVGDGGAADAAADDAQSGWC